MIPLVVAGTLAIAATAASGVQPARLDPIADSAFRPVTVAGKGAAPDAAAAVRSLAADNSADRLTDADVISELSVAPSPVPRARPSTGTPQPVVVNVPPPAPKTSGSGATGGSGGGGTTHSLRGYASYYCYAGSSPCTTGYPDSGGFDAYAAAGPKLRAALGSTWRGRIVYVDGIRVKLIDWCQCYKGEPQEKLLDLYHDVYARTGSPVTIRW